MMNINKMYNEFNKKNDTYSMVDLSSISEMITNGAKGVWLRLNCDTDFINFLQNCDKKELCVYHPTFNITVLQWLLWYIGSGVRAFAQQRMGAYSRKEWAFHKIELMKKNLSQSLWKALVHTPTGFEKKCTTFHFFCRNGYTIDCNHLNSINKWMDDVGGRQQYQYDVDEYGHKASEYVAFHRNRQQKFRKQIKSKVDPLVTKYHNIEKQLKADWQLGRNFLGTNAPDYWEWLKEVSSNGNNITYTLPQKFRTNVLESAKTRIDSHIFHDDVFKDRLSEIEKAEEKKGRGFSQTTNHLWIIRTYQVLLNGTPEGKLLSQYLKNKKMDRA